MSCRHGLGSEKPTRALADVKEHQRAGCVGEGRDLVESFISLQMKERTCSAGEWARCLILYSEVQKSETFGLPCILNSLGFIISFLILSKFG